MEYSYCTECETNIEHSLLEVFEVDGVTLVGCPRCGNIMSAKADSPVSNDAYMLTTDQCTYTIHCLLKQEAKLQHALAQVHHTITKLEILRELAKEKELN